MTQRIMKSQLRMKSSMKILLFLMFNDMTMQKIFLGTADYSEIRRNQCCFQVLSSGRKNHDEETLGEDSNAFMNNLEDKVLGYNVANSYDEPKPSTGICEFDSNISAEWIKEAYKW